MKISPIVEEYLQYLADNRHRSANTLESYQHDLRQYCEFLNDPARKPHPLETSGLSVLLGPDLSERIFQATSKTAQDFCELLKARFYAAATIARKCAAVEGFYRYLQKTGQIRQNPFGEFRFVKPKSGGRVCMEDSHFEKLLASVPCDNWMGIRDKTIAILLYATGVKVGELSRLTLSDYSAGERLLYIRRAGGKTRTVSVCDRATVVVQEYISLRQTKTQGCNPPTEIMFINRDYQPITVRSIRRKLKQYGKEAGFTFAVTPEVLRRSYAVKMQRRGVPLEQIARQMGYLSAAALKQQMELNETSTL